MDTSEACEYEGEKLLSDPETIDLKKHKSLLRRRSAQMGQIITASFAVWGFLALIIWPGATEKQVLRHIGECDCGDSIAEAIQMSCKWDSLASAWLPGRCRDDILTAEFERNGPAGGWVYYTDQAGSETLNVTQVSMLAESTDRVYWTTLEWHMLHCTFYWKKEWRKRYTGKQIELKFDNITHIQHCEEVLVDRSRSPSDKLIAQTAELKSDNYPP